MLATGTTLGCGLTICVAVFTTEAQAVDVEKAQRAEYRFGEWTVVVQPGLPAPRAALSPPSLVIEPGPTGPARIELTGLQQVPLPPLPPDVATTELPIDAVLQAAAVDDATASDERKSEPATATSSPADLTSRSQLYRTVYNSIPFSRAEYEANPSYRHDATMEFLFGQMRPTVIHRQQRTRIDVNMPSLPNYGGGLEFNRYGIHNRWSPYMYPPYRW